MLATVSCQLTVTNRFIDEIVLFSFLYIRSSILPHRWLCQETRQQISRVVGTEDYVLRGVCAGGDCSAIC